MEIQKWNEWEKGAESLYKEMMLENLQILGK